MKTEEIAEKAKEYADLYAREVQILMQAPGSMAGCFNGYLKGYEACNVEWQEKLRWISVEERLPEVGKKVEVKYIQGSISHKYFIQTGHLKENGRFTGEMDWIRAAHWREIIE